MNRKFVLFPLTALALAGCSTTSQLSVMESARAIPFIKVSYNAAEKEREYRNIINEISSFSAVYTCMVDAVDNGAVQEQPLGTVFTGKLNQLSVSVAELEGVKAELEPVLEKITAKKNTGDHDITEDPLFSEIGDDIRQISSLKKSTLPRANSVVGSMNDLYKQMAKNEVDAGIPIEDRKVVLITDCVLAYAN